MTVQLQFDAHQQFQLDAVQAVVDLFEGQPQAAGGLSFKVGVANDAGIFASIDGGIGNNLVLDRQKLLENLHSIQNRQGLRPDESLLPDKADDANAPAPLNFTVEMETGTGKTYVYLRTIRELNRAYGWSKFLIIVPSVAIREGTLQALKGTDAHFRQLYDGQPLDFFVYDGKKPADLAAFARATSPSVCVINIQAFIKDGGADESSTGNVIYKPMDQLGGRPPIEFVQQTQPIVIVDEPQSVDATEKSKAAIRRLNPLMTLRYSATHREPYNEVFNLDPVQARKLGLVKSIVVSSVKLADGSVPAGCYLKVLKISYAGKSKMPSAEIELRVQDREKGDGSPKPTKVRLKGGEDLHHLSGEIEAYRGMFVETIDASDGAARIILSTGHELGVGQELGGVGGDLQRLMVRRTVEKHLEKEKQLVESLAHSGRRVKVLSLFFLDRVADYRQYDEAGNTQPGDVAKWFMEAVAELKQQPRFGGLDLWKHPLEQLHDGYFAKDKKGRLKDSTGRESQDDQTAYELIMQDKGKLLDPDVPLRFIFSHSALREGWDNPNVFQICKLGGAQTTTRRRQELGRGLRLPVDSTGQRIRDERINELAVIGSEDFASFAKGLQSELEEDCGVTFGKVKPRAFAALELMRGDTAEPLGFEKAKEIWETLRTVGVLTDDGTLVQGVSLAKLPEWLKPEYRPLSSAIEKVLEEHRLERHVREDRPRSQVKLNKHVKNNPAFTELWNRISRRTRYRVAFESAKFIEQAAKAIRYELPMLKLEVEQTDGKAVVEAGGVRAVGTRRTTKVLETRDAVPDPLAYLQTHVELTRSTLAAILKNCDRLEDFMRQPQRFLEEVGRLLQRELARFIVESVKYEKVEGFVYEQRLLDGLDGEEAKAFVDRLVTTKNNKSLFEPVECDSETEMRFAQAMDAREDVVLFAKLPRWFRVPTPVGDYIPDWAIVKKDDQGEPKLYLVRETKGALDAGQLRLLEKAKIDCAKKHFASLDVDFAVAVTADQV